MKKITTVILLLMAVLTMQAQSTNFGVKAGVNQNTFYLKEEGSSGARYVLSKSGFHAGFIADLGFNEHFSIQPQLLFASKGGKINLGGGDTDFDFLTIDLPVNFLYNYNGFFIGAGPNLSYGLSGKEKISGSPDVDLYEDGVVGSGKFKHLEIGANVLMGFRFPSGFMVSANYTPGLTDSFDEDAGSTDEIKSTNSFIGFSIGYMFGKKMITKK